MPSVGRRIRVTAPQNIPPRPRSLRLPDSTSVNSAIRSTCRRRDTSRPLGAAPKCAAPSSLRDPYRDPIGRSELRSALYCQCRNRSWRGYAPRRMSRVVTGPTQAVQQSTTPHQRQTLKERLSDKQRVDNCKVPVDAAAQKSAPTVAITSHPRAESCSLSAARGTVAAAARAAPSPLQTS